MTETVTQTLKDRFDTTFLENVPLTEEQAAAALAEYDVIMPTLGDKFSAGAFKNGSPRCRLLANFGAGYNHIDLAAASAADVAVTNTPGVVTDATADIALTLLLMIARRASEGERVVRAGEWTGWNPTQFLGTHVSGKTVGIIGMGRIGKAIAARCHYGFGMDVVFHNRSTVSALDFPAQQMPGLDEMMKAADFAVIAVPGGAETRHMIGKDALAALGPRSYLINIARGDVVDEAALIEALQNNVIAGAGLDVYEREPEVPEALRVLNNVTLLPHLGTAAEEVRTAMGLRATDNIFAFVDGKELPDRVN